MKKHRILLIFYGLFIIWGFLWTHLDPVIYFAAVCSAIYYSKWIEREDEVEKFNEEVGHLLDNGTH